MQKPPFTNFFCPIVHIPNYYSIRQDKVYHIVVASLPHTVYCHMSELPGCGAGGWTLAMKIDGTKVRNFVLAFFRDITTYVLCLQIGTCVAVEFAEWMNADHID